MVGDSHVCSKIYPHGVERILEKGEPDIKFSFFGKIGAGFYTYIDSKAYMNEIYEADPDILIVHLGTNDSYTRNFSKKKFLNDVRVFYKDVVNHFPECKIVFVTPFYNKLKGSKQPNRNTRKCADALLEFANDQRNCYVIDNNADYGMIFLKHCGDLMRNDCTHLTEKGYQRLAEQVGEALLKIEDLWIIEEPPYLGETEEDYSLETER